MDLNKPFSLGGRVWFPAILLSQAYQQRQHNHAMVRIALRIESYRGSFALSTAPYLDRTEFGFSLFQ